MNGLALIGILLIVYAAFLVFVAVKKPDKIWHMAKIRMFIKVMGEQGTVIFFYVFAAICLAGGIYLML